MDKKLRQSSDIENIVRCRLPDNMMAMNVHMNDIKHNRNR